MKKLWDDYLLPALVMVVTGGLLALAWIWQTP